VVVGGQAGVLEPRRQLSIVAGERDVLAGLRLLLVAHRVPSVPFV
jgi:hypothetical protein